MTGLDLFQKSGTSLLHCPQRGSMVISALNTLWIEDPSLSFSINSYSDELEIWLYGLTQKEIIQTLLEERFSVKVHFDEIKTIYKERPD